MKKVYRLFLLLIAATVNVSAKLYDDGMIKSSDKSAVGALKFANGKNTLNNLTGKQSMNSGKNLSFVENKGQITDQNSMHRHDIQYSLAAASGLNIFIGNGAIHYQFSKCDNPELLERNHDPKSKFNNLATDGHLAGSEKITYSMYRMDVELVGANKNAQIETEEKTAYYENYFTPNTGENGATAHAYNRITYKNVYPNIDWVLYTSTGQLKHEFVVHKGGRVSDIKLKYGGATSLKLDNAGALIAGTPQGKIKEQAPYTYQKDGKKVASGFYLNGEILSYNVSDYTGELVIDPNLVWATYYGGSDGDYPTSSATSSNGDAFIAGETKSTMNIATSGGFLVTYAGGISDAFMAKFNSAGARQWATYYGGSGDDKCHSMTLDASGNVYLAGWTLSSSGIATAGTHLTTFPGNATGFVAKFDNAGNRIWGTYCGGTLSDYGGYGLAVDGSGNVFMSGYTESVNGIATAGAHQTSFAGGGFDIFLQKFNSSGVRLWGTYYGGTTGEEANQIATDAAGNVYLAGGTSSATGIASASVHQGSIGGASDAFLAKFNGSGVRQWATYYGGTGSESAYAIATDAMGNVYMAGQTASTTGIATSGVHQASIGSTPPAADGFVVKFNSSGVRQWGTYYGGTDWDYITGIQVDSKGYIYLSGSTTSTNAIATAGVAQSVIGGGQDAFVAKLNSNGLREWGTYFGGAGSEEGVSISANDNGVVNLAGYSNSTSGITTADAYQVAFGGIYDAFLAAYSDIAPVVTSLTPIAANPGTSVTITGSNFNTTPANNIVYFGATKATVTAASTTSITATVPVGATFMPVSVNNIASALTGFQQYPFLPTFDNSGYVAGVVNFNDRVNFTASGSNPAMVSMKDIDGDGKTDLAITNFSSNVVSIFRNIATSGTVTSFSYESAVSFATGTSPYGTSIVDIDGDNKPDLIVTNYTPSGTVSVFRNTSTTGLITGSSFASRVDFNVGVYPRGVAVGDIDGDGKPEIIVANQGGDISILRNTSAIGIIDVNSFAAKVDFSNTLSPYNISLGDIDGDGKVDIITGNLGTNTVSAFRNISIVGSITAISLASKVDFTVASGTYHAVVGDFDGDGKQDIAAVCHSTNNVSVLRNTATAGIINSASFSSAVNFSAGSSPFGLALGDLNGDGKIDMVATNYSSNTVSVFRNTATSGSINSGSFATKVDFSTGSFPWSIAVGDVDGDTRSDLVVNNWGANSFSVFRNNPLSPIAGSLTVCVASTTTLTTITTGGAWSSSNTSIATIGSTGIVTGVAGGTAVISYTTGGGSATTTITVNLLPNAGTITGASSVCAGSNITLGNATTGGVWTSSATGIATVGSTGITTGIAAGTAIISYTVTNSCGSVSATKTITVNPLPIAGVGVSSTLSSSVSGGTWSSSATGIATVGSTGIVSGIAAGSTTISYSVTNSCGTAVATRVITVINDTLASRAWATYYGGSNYDDGITVATDGARNIYITGRTSSTSGMATSGAHQTTLGGSGDAFLVKFNSAGVRQWATYYGGSGDEQGYSVATDISGNVYLSGQTFSSSGIATSGAYQTAHGGGGGDAFIVKFDSLGVRQWATYFGGSGMEYSYVLATDISGNVCLSGASASTSGIASSGAHQTTHAGGTNDAFLAKFSTTGSLQWSTYYGSSSDEFGYSTAADNSGNVFLAGYTSGTTGLATGGAHQTASGGGIDGFLVKFNSAGVRQWATYYGGSGYDYCNSTAVDVFGNVYVTGPTESSSGMVSGSGYQLTRGGGMDAYLAKFNSSGVRQWGTYYGGSGTEQGYSVATDIHANVYLTGQTNSTTGISSSGAFQPTFAGTSDVFLVKFSSSGSRRWGTYYGSSGNEYGSSVATDTSGNIFVIGLTNSTSGIASSTAHQPTFGGSTYDAFLVRFSAISAITGSNSICEGATVSLSNATTGGTWSSSNTSIATVGSSSGVVYGVAAGTSVISYNTSSGAAIVAVTVYPLPNAGTITGTSLIGIGGTGALSASVSGGTWSSSATGIATVGSTGIVAGLSGGTVAISYGVSSALCANTVVKLLAVTNDTLAVRAWGTYYGGSGGENGRSVAVDRVRNIYITGRAQSTSAIATSGAHQSSHGGGTYDAYLVKFDSTGVRQWGTFYGGSNDDIGTSVTTDSAGNVYVCGSTMSTSGIATSGAHQTIHGSGTYDGFVVKFNSSGIRQWGTYYGGNNDVYGASLITDISRNVYFVGSTYSNSGIATSGAYQGARAGVTDAFIVKFDSVGNRQWGTYFGGSGQEEVFSIAGDVAGNLYIGGYTASTSGISTSGAFQSSHAGGIMDAFLVKFNSGGARQWGTYYGGSGNEETSGYIATDASGGIYLAGRTNSTSGIATSGGHVDTFGGGSFDAFLVKFDSSGWRKWGTYYAAEARAIATDGNSNVILVGVTGSPTNISTNGGHQTVLGGGSADAYVAKFNNSGIRLVGTYYGGGSIDEGGSVAVDGSGNIFLTGYTQSTSGIASGTAHQATFGGVEDAFLVRFGAAVLSSVGVIAGTSTLCVGSTTSLSNTTTGGTWTSSNTSVATVGTSSGMVTGVSGGTATISYSVSGGSAAKTVTVNALPTIVVGGNTIIYAGSSTSLTANGGVSYTWTPGTGLSATTGATISANPSTATSYTVTGTNSAGCSNTAIVTVSVVAVPTMAGSTACPGSVLTVNSTPQPINIVWQQAGVGISTVTPTYASSATTVAGTGTAGSSANQLDQPNAVYVDAGGNIYIADQNNHRIQKWAPGATSGTTVAGTGTSGSGANQLLHPYGVYVDAGGNIYVADQGNNRIQKWAPGATSGTRVAGNVTGGSGANQLNGPVGVFVDAGGNIYVADQTNNRIQKWAPGATSGTTIAGNGTSGSAANQLNNPTGVYVDEGGNIYVSDCYNNRIQKWAPGATSGTTVAGNGTFGSGVNQLSNPTGVYVDAGGNIYVADYVNNRIQKWAPGATSGTRVAGTGSSGSGANQLWYPRGAFVDAGGNIYVADNNNQRIQKFAASIVNTYTAATAGSYAALVTTQVGAVTTNTVTVNALPNAGTITGASSVNAGSTITLSNTTTGGVWSSSSTSVATVGSTGVVTGVAVGTATITYSVSNSCGTSAVTKAVTVNAATASCDAWTITGTAGFSAGTAYYTSIAMDGSGVPYVAYRDVANSNKATVMKFSGGSWVTVGTAGFSIGDVSYISLAIDGSGSPYVAYWDEANSNKATVMKFNGSAWVAVGSAGFSAGGAEYITIAIDGSGAPYVAFQDHATGQKATVMKYNGSSWIIVGSAGFSTGLADRVSSALDGSGMSYVVYYDGSNGGKATVKKYNGSSWVTVGSAGFSAGQIDWPTIAIDISGVPYVAYRDAANSNKATVMKYDGGSWVTVGTAGFSTGMPGKTFIAIDGSGVPYVAYSDAGISNKATVKKLSGGSWLTVGSEGLSAGTAGNTSIAIDGSGVPYVVYADGTIGGKATVQQFGTALAPITGTSTVCVSATTTLTNTTTGGTWSTSTPTVATVGTSGIVTGVGAGTATISYVVSGGCAATKIVTVNPLPNSGTITGSTSVCVGGNITLSNTITGGTWSSSNTSVATVGSTGIVNGVAAGTSIISYSVTNGCGTVSATKVITVNTTPSAGTIIGVSSVCAGSTITLSNAASGGSWSSSVIGIATVNSSGIVTGIAVGTAVVSYTVSNSCGTVSALRIVSVNPLPVAGTITGASSVNAGATITLSNTITGGVWSSSNTSVATIGSTGIVTGIAGGTTTISYTVSNSCGSVSATRVVTVTAVLETPITGTLTVCAGSSTTLSNATSGGAWSSSNTMRATVNSEGIVSGVSAGTAIISYSIPGSTVTAIVTINALPATGTFAGSSTACTGTTLTLFNSVSGGTWSSSSDGATVSSTGVVTGVAAGLFTISYTVTNECGTSVATKDITILSIPDAGTIAGTASLCVGTTTTLSNATTGGTWSSGYAAAATVDAAGLVTGVGAGSSTISYRMTNFCGTTYATRVVTVNPLPNAGTIGGLSAVCEGNTITMPFISAAGCWSSSNPSAATIDNSTRIVTGVAAGTTTISFTVTNSCGTATSTKVITVNPDPVAGSLSGASVLCAGATTTITPSVSGGTWVSSNPTFATVTTSGVVTGVAAGSITISYFITNGCGVASATHALTINPAVGIGTIGGGSSVCAGSTIALTNTTTGGTWSSTNTGAATIGTTGVLTGVAEGTTTISYVVSNSCGTATATKDVTVNPLPIAGTISGPSAMCTGTTISLSTTGTGGSWISGAPSFATISSAGVVTATAVGS
eukprot:gene5482-11029_t